MTPAAELTVAVGAPLHDPAALVDAVLAHPMVRKALADIPRSIVQGEGAPRPLRVGERYERRGRPSCGASRNYHRRHTGGRCDIVYTAVVVRDPNWQSVREQALVEAARLWQGPLPARVCRYTVVALWQAWGTP